MVLATAEHDVPPDSVKFKFEVIFNNMLEYLKEQFPPPAEAPGHDNRTATVSAVLDFIEKNFWQFAIKLGVSEKSPKVYSGPLKFYVQTIVVTIGDLIEQHPKLALALALALLSTVMIETGVLDLLLTQVLKIFGFGPLGPIGGSLAAWVQGWLFPSAITKGSWFAVLQRLAMIL